jgi:hypothetical protein
MASDAMMQAIGRLERAITRMERLSREMAEHRAREFEARIAALAEAPDEPEVVEQPVEIEQFSRDKAIAALKSLDALIGDLQKARTQA